MKTASILLALDSLDMAHSSARVDRARVIAQISRDPLLVNTGTINVEFTNFHGDRVAEVAIAPEFGSRYGTEQVRVHVDIYRHAPKHPMPFEDEASVDKTVDEFAAAIKRIKN